MLTHKVKVNKYAFLCLENGWLFIPLKNIRRTYCMKKKKILSYI